MGKPSDYPTCIGLTVSDGVVGSSEATSNANFGLTKNNTFVIGAVSPSEVNTLEGGFTQLLTGFGWLVYGGEAQPSSDTEIAPRTTIGVDAKGRILMFEVFLYLFL